MYDIYVSYKRSKPQNHFNKVVLGSSIFLSTLYFYLSYNFFSENLTPQNILSFLSLISESSLIISTGILGFLITGFSIFAGTTDKSTFIILAKKMRNKDISQLQFIFFNFINTFIIYISLLFSSYISKIITKLIVITPPNEGFTIFILSSICILLICQTIHSMLILKSFIFNLYQSILLSIAIHDRNQPPSQDACNQQGEP